MTAFDRAVARRSRPSHLWRAGAGLALAVSLAACQAHPAARPAVPTPTAAPAGPRVVVVDFDRVVHAHPRWGDLDAIDRRIADLEGRLSAAPAPQLQLPQINLEPELQAAAQHELEQVRPQYQQQFTATLDAAREAARKELEAYAAQVRAEAQAAFNKQQDALQAQFTKALQDKEQANNQDNEQFQQQTLAQYRLPLLNLQLRRDALRGGDRQALQAVGQQIDAMTKERDDKIAAHEKANLQALSDFQQQQQDAYAKQIKDLQDQMIRDGQQKIEQRQKEINDRIRRQLEAKQAELNAQMKAQLEAQFKERQQALVQGAREQVARAEEKAVADARLQLQALRAQLADAQGERARLLDSIMADVRVEAAALAQQQGYDVILTRAVGTVGITDVTDDLIARIKR